MPLFLFIYYPVYQINFSCETLVRLQLFCKP